LEKLQPGHFLISVEDFKEAFKKFTVIHLHPEFHNSFIEKRNVGNKKNYRFNFTISAEDILAANIEAP
jgi:hypothetical protein